MVLPIRTDGDDVLRSKANPLPEELFGTSELKKMLDDMSDTLDAEKDGVAIAAPQVGIPYRIFLVRYDRMLAPSQEAEEEPMPEVGVFINPSFVRLSKKNTSVDEGCLSVRNVYGKTKRKDRATVKAYDASGKKFERGAGGLLAQAFQHEMDHLEGVLFIDHATDLLETREEDREENRKKRQAKRLADGMYNETSDA